MDISRYDVARRDFPRSVDGYDPAAVDEHLSALADLVEALQERLGGVPGESAERLAAYAGQHVQQLFEAAQQTAAAITEQAHEEARAIVAGAAHEADEARRVVAEAIGGSIKRLEQQTAALNESFRAQEDIAREMQRTIEGLELPALPDADEQDRGGELIYYPEQPNTSDGGALSRSGAPSMEPMAETSAFVDHSSGSMEDDLRLLAVNLLLNGAAVDEVKARLWAEYPGADVDAAIEDAKRHL